MAKVSVLNVGKGPRSVRTLVGVVTLGVGESKELDVSDAELASIRQGGALSVKGLPFGGKGDHDHNGADGGARHPDADQYEATIAELRQQAEEATVAIEGRDASIAAMRKTIAAIPLPEKLEDLKREELDELALGRGVDISEAKNKGDVIAALQLSVEKQA